MGQVVLENLGKTFTRLKGTTVQSQVSVLNQINLTVADGEFLVLVGPSGCGKSTLLRIIAGLEQPTSGNIFINDRCVNPLPPKARDIAMVFQSYALYPHLSVYDNLAFGLRRLPAGLSTRSRLHPSLESALIQGTKVLPKALQYRSPREQEIQARVQRVAQLLQIEPLLKRLPKQLSGGQKQRVALGRAIARSPQVFLMDEPLSNLDAQLRGETRAQIVTLQRQLAVTTLYVTHDQVEAMTMGQRIAVLNQGNLQQIDTPLNLYHHPKNRFVAEFIGSPPMNFVTVYLKPPGTIVHATFRYSLPEQQGQHLFDRAMPQDASPALVKLCLGIRPEHLSFGKPALKNIAAIVQRVEPLGQITDVTVQLRAQPYDPELPLEAEDLPLWQVRVDSDLTPQPGEQVYLTLNLDRVHFFAPESGQAI
ncbi:MAG: ABC transporter ATP-binding protein [Prochlorotrichaceae cyanobacterium]|jgi:multiple sugar transport system ATP-binding protein